MVGTCPNEIGLYAQIIDTILGMIVKQFERAQCDDLKRKIIFILTSYHSCISLSILDHVQSPKLSNGDGKAHAVYLYMNVTKLAIDMTRLLSKFNQTWGC